MIELCFQRLIWGAKHNKDGRGESEKEAEPHVIAHWVVYLVDSKELDNGNGGKGREINAVVVKGPTWFGIWLDATLY